jgi:predicted  nucleic acid-binding Zn-ribbon protein
MAKGQEDLLKSFVEIEVSAIEMDVKTQQNILNQVKQAINTLNIFSSDAEEIFKRDANSVKRSLDEIDEIGKRIESMYQKSKADKEFITKLNDEADKEISKLMEKAAEIKEADLGVVEAEKVIKDMHAKVHLVEARLEEAKKSFYENIASQRKEMENVSRSINEEMKSFNNVISQEERWLRDTQKSKDAYGRDAERITKSAIDGRKRILDEAHKTKEDVDRLYAIADSKIGNMLAGIALYKKNFGKLGEIDRKVKSLKEDTKRLDAERNTIQDAYALVLKEVENLKIDQTLKPEAKELKLKEIGKRAKDMNGRLDKLVSEAQDARGKGESLIN